MLHVSLDSAWNRYCSNSELAARPGTRKPTSSTLALSPPFPFFRAGGDYAEGISVVRDTLLHPACGIGHLCRAQRMARAGRRGLPG
jgi:hypothetical protein